MGDMSLGQRQGCEVAFALLMFSAIVVVFTSGDAAANQRIAPGRAFTCAIDDVGVVKCWGQNWNGQLGDSSNRSHDVPSRVRGLGGPAIAIAAGGAHACAVIAGGDVKCWGANESGQLGNGSTVESAVPVDVVGLGSSAVSISAGRAHTCAITSTAQLKCWGLNNSGQLGDQTTTNRSTAVLALTGVLNVAAGGNHTCAVDQTHSALCWGRGSRGQLGNGSLSSWSIPFEVTGMSSGVAAVTAGYEHSCAQMTTGALKCWGGNWYGQLGNATNSDQNEPVDVVSASAGASELRAGSYHTCAIVEGIAKCWGINITGRLGTGSRVDANIPVAVTGLAGSVQQFGAGGSQTCALMGDDVFSCWGSNSYGQIGVGFTGHTRRAGGVTGLDSATTAIGVGSEHACAIHSGGVVCWGDNRSGQLGNGSYLEASVPTAVVGLTTGALSISVKSNHTCALATGGVAKCWGENAKGQLGDGSQVERTAPVEVLGLGSGVLQIATGSDFSCALTALHGVKCWGSNELGALGNGSTDDHFVAEDVMGLTSGISAISAGPARACAVLDAGSVKCWGVLRQELGGSSVSREPQDMTGFTSNITAITSGPGHDCVSVGDVVLQCAGGNYYGELGDGTTIDSPVNPMTVVGFDTGVTSPSAGFSYTCAIDGSGVAKCWGVNDYGQLGDGTEQFMRIEPGNVVNLGTGIAAISAGLLGSCAVSSTGAASCWGENLFGQLGNGQVGSVLVPAEVLINEEIFRETFE